jgi:hypothetical protein
VYCAIIFATVAQVVAVAKNRRRSPLIDSVGLDGCALALSRCTLSLCVRRKENVIRFLGYLITSFVLHALLCMEQHNEDKYV